VNVDEETSTYEQSLEDYAALPTDQSHRLIDFDTANVVSTRSIPPQHFLSVSGTKPYLNMHVELSPLVYIRRPEYWGIEVVGSLPGIGLPATAPYTVSIRLEGIVGTKGIAVIGASRTEEIDIPSIGRPGDLPEQLFREWRHSFEDDAGDGVETYRPEGFSFPPAFGRRGFEISRDGGFVAHEIGPADEPLEIPGHWTATGAAQLSVTLEGGDPFTLTIVSIDDDVLRVRRG
jgi:hypothetical protein